MTDVFPQYYILLKHVPIAVDMWTWARWFENNPKACQIAETKIGKVRVSTIFLGLDHAFHGGGPILFETMVFKGPLDHDMWRYATWGEAARGHAAVVEQVKKAIAAVAAIAEDAGADHG